jgi:hypothetical protein
VRQTFGVSEAPVQLRPDDLQADPVPAIEGLLDPLAQLRHRRDLGVNAGAVAELEEAMEAGVVCEECELLVAELPCHREHLLRVLQSLVNHLGRSQRPVTRVQSRDERL